MFYQGTLDVYAVGYSTVQTIGWGMQLGESQNDELTWNEVVDTLTTLYEAN